MTLSRILKALFTLMLCLQLISCNNSQSTVADSNTNDATPQSKEKSNQPVVNINPDKQPATPPDNSQSASETLLPTISSASQEEGSAYQRIDWDSLLPDDYQPEVIIEKYMKQLAELDDSDPKAMQLYGTIQAELENAPINEKLNNKKVQLAGFITPLENTGGLVTEFLLVPYFGACIHVPPPPINQTVLIQMEKGQGIKTDNIYDPIWASGEILAEGSKTDLAQAGYRIINAKVIPFEE